MNNRRTAETGLAKTLLALLALIPASLLAQVPVGDNGEIIGTYEEQAPETGNEEIPLLSTAELEELIGPIALYPDDLLAIVLPASAYPLQIIEAGRFLEAIEDDPTLKPDPDWDDSVVALVNYPEVVELLNEDIDWTWRLGEAVVSQQADVVSAIENFRDRAYAAGNLKSDSYQNVTREEGVIEITPVTEDVIYVPYYEPERVVVYQPRPVYYYYPRAYPVYYYPYSAAHAFHDGFFWGVTTAFTIGWYSDSLNVFHHSYHGHPYYGRHYWDRWWYRRPSVSVYNTTYITRSTPVTINRYYGGDRWRPRHNRRDYVDDVRVTRSRYTRHERDGDLRRRTSVRRDADVQRTSVRRSVQRSGEQRRASRQGERRERLAANSERREPITFRQRPQTLAMNRHSDADYRAEPRNKRDTATRSRPTPKARQATPREHSATVRRQESTARTSRRSQEPAARTPRRSQEPAARTSRRSQETRRVQEPRRDNVRRSEPRRSEGARRSAEQRPQRNSAPRQEKKAEPRRAPEQRSHGKRDRTSERDTRRRR